MSLRREAWVIGSKALMDSTSSPNSSIRTGSPKPGGHTSISPPRCANSPRPVTSALGSYPPATRRSSSTRWPTRSPTRTAVAAAASCCGAAVRCANASRLPTVTRCASAMPDRTESRWPDSSCSGSARSRGNAARSGRTRRARPPISAARSSASRCASSSVRVTTTIGRDRPSRRAARCAARAAAGTRRTPDCGRCGRRASTSAATRRSPPRGVPEMRESY